MYESLNGFILVFFPITLKSPWVSKIEFSHIGNAESPDGRADVLEALVNKTTNTSCFLIPSLTYSYCGRSSERPKDAETRERIYRFFGLQENRKVSDCPYGSAEQ